MPLVGERKRSYERSKSKQRTTDKNDVGAPEITSDQRRQGTLLRNKCRKSLLNFNILCFPNSTGLKPFGKVQIDSISHDQDVILHGGNVLKLEPRGFAKTSRSVNAALWAVLYNYRRMVPIFKSSVDQAKTQIMEAWKTELLGNDLLFWMFPELLWPFRFLGDNAQGAKGLHRKGKPLRIKWLSDRIVFPTIKNQRASGNILMTLSLENPRGATHKLVDGTVLRPEFCILDDVQKDEDAANPNTINKMVSSIDHGVMMLGGHSQTMSVVMNGTVRCADDLYEQYCCNTSWQHVRYKMLERPADNEKDFWLGRYAEVRRRYDPLLPRDKRRAQRESLALYQKEWEYANAGAIVSWEWAYAYRDEEQLEISAIQRAYNILIDKGEDVFASECQNEPIRETGGLAMLTAAEIRRKQSGYPRTHVPKDVTVITASVDVHPGILYWHVWAFEPLFVSYLIDDGTFPRQAQRNFRHDMLGMTLSRMLPGHDQSATIFAALKMLLEGTDDEPGLLRKEYMRIDGTPMKISQVGIDASGDVSDPINKFIRQSPFGAIMIPTYGVGITAKKLPLHLYNNYKEGDDHWVKRKGKPGDPPGVLFDTNYWKSSLHRALALPAGSQGGASIYSVEKESHWYRFSEACHSERPVEVTAEGRTIYEFGEPRLGTFNHDFDCAVIARVMASKAGIRSVNAEKPKKPRLTLEEMAARARRNGR